MNAHQSNATRYNLSILQETHNSAEIQSESTQIVVTVRAKNETQEAANILGATLICHLGSSLTKAFLSELIVRERKTMTTTADPTHFERGLAILAEMDTHQAGQQRVNSLGDLGR